MSPGSPSTYKKTFSIFSVSKISYNFFLPPIRRSSVLTNHERQKKLFHQVFFKKLLQQKVFSRTQNTNFKRFFNYELSRTIENKLIISTTKSSSKLQTFSSKKLIKNVHKLQIAVVTFLKALLYTLSP